MISSMEITMKNLLLLFLFTNLTACSIVTPIFNKPVKTNKIKAEKTIPTGAKAKLDDVSLILTFSGGGTRAAALSYGVLKELRNTTIPSSSKTFPRQRKTLLSEVDIISSVSGGSFTSAYYGLYGDRIFKDYEKRFLKKPVQTGLINTFLNPFNWRHLGNRSELVSSYYEKNIFGKKTFHDLRRDGPQIVINTTDISAGTAFSFTPENFRWICSDLGSYPVGRAVTASSAVPVLFSPLPLKNYSGCKPYSYQTKNSLVNRSRNDEQAFGVRKYQDKKRYPYLHLLDGGITDNLGIRSLLHVVSEHNNDFWQVMKSFGLQDTKKVAFIVVNAADSLSPLIARNRNSPSASNTMAAVSTIQLKRYNTDTLDLLSHNLKTWQRQVKKERCKETKKADCDDIKFYLVELNFKQLPPKEAQAFSLIETSMELPEKTVDGLILAGQYLLKNSPEFKTILKDLNAQ